MLNATSAYLVRQQVTQSLYRLRAESTTRSNVMTSLRSWAAAGGNRSIEASWTANGGSMPSSGNGSDSISKYDGGPS